MQKDTIVGVKFITKQNNGIFLFCLKSLFIITFPERNPYSSALYNKFISKIGSSFQIEMNNITNKCNITFCNLKMDSFEFKANLVEVKYLASREIHLGIIEDLSINGTDLLLKSNKFKSKISNLEFLNEFNKLEIKGRKIILLVIKFQNHHILLFTDNKYTEILKVFIENEELFYKELVSGRI